MDNINNAKRVLDENAKVLYGIFGFISYSGYFPPLPFLNEFFLAGRSMVDIKDLLAHSFKKQIPMRHGTGLAPCYPTDSYVRENGISVQA
ncbi:hypothetical protein [Ewingella americana]|jgi:hypothetical protein